jgi:predicted exporter
MGIGLAITLTLPLVFIYCMGSDYGLHLAYACQRGADTEEVFRTTGKAILFSFLTTFGAFALFTRVSDLAGRRTMIGTTVAIGIIFVVTLLLIPMFYPTKKRTRAAERAPLAMPSTREAPVVFEGSN